MPGWGMVLVLRGTMLAQGGATATPTPGATPAPTPSGGLSGIVDTTEKVAKLATNAALIAVSVIAVVALLVLVWRLVGLSLQRQLVVPDFVDGSGVADLAGKVQGLSRVGREELLENMRGVRNTVERTYRRYGVELGTSQQPLPRAAPLDTVSDLLDSFTALGDKAGWPLAGLLKPILLRPRGTQATVTLQCRGKTPDRMGMTVEIGDLRGRKTPEGFTMWEPPHVAALRDEPAETAPAPGPARWGGLVPPIATLLFGSKPTPPVAAELVVAERLEDAGAMEEAQLAFVEAVKAKGGPAAEAGLRRTLAVVRGADARLLSLARAAMRRLALELVRGELTREMTDRWRLNMARSELWYRVGPSIEERQSTDRGWLYNYMGSLYQASALVQDRYREEFLRLARDELETAVALIGGMYQPYENLGDTLSFLASAVQDKARNAADGTASEEWQEEAYQLFRSAVSQYERALGRAALMQDPAGRREVERRLGVSLAVNQLLTEDPTSQLLSKEVIRELEHGWDPADERDARLLQQLSAWYGIAARYRVVGPDGRRDGRKVLAYALGRDVEREYWSDAEAGEDSLSLFRHDGEDDDAAARRVRESVQRLEEEIERELDRSPATDFRAEDGQAFVQTMQRLMAEAGWAEDVQV